MRTKSLLLAAALGVAGAFSSSAQSTNVYSVNAVGYVKLNLVAGFNLIVNPLTNSTGNTISVLLTNVADSTTFFKWNPATQRFTSASVFFEDGLGGGAWFPNATWNPGEAAFVNSTTATNVTFVGDVTQGSALTVPFSIGYTMVASQVPQSLTLTNSGINFPAADSDVFFKWNPLTQRYTSALVFFEDGLGGGQWSPSTPSINVGEGFFISKSSPTNWVRSFSANN